MLNAIKVVKFTNNGHEFFSTNLNQISTFSVTDAYAAGVCANPDDLRPTCRPRRYRSDQRAARGGDLAFTLAGLATLHRCQVDDI